MVQYNAGLRGFRVIGLRRPSWFAVLLTLAGMAFFVRLGVWQLNRAAEKEVLLRRFATAATAPIQDFSSVQDGVSSDHYPHLRLRGSFLGQRVYMLDDQQQDGHDGIEVYAPFRPQGYTRLVLVDLGFLPHGSKQRIPSLPPLKSGSVTVTGMYAPPPSAGLKLGGNALAKQSTWPKLSIYIDLKQIAADLHAKLYPRVLLLDPDEASAYVRHWTPSFIPPSKHRGYAFQWFAFAVAAVVIFLVLHRKRETEEEDE